MPSASLAESKMLTAMFASSHTDLPHRFTDKEVQRDLKMFPFKVVNKDTKPCIEVELKDGKKTFQAEEISAMVLTKMKETAEAYLGKDIKHAVVTVPGVFIAVQHSLLILKLLCSIFQWRTTPGDERCRCNCWLKRSSNYQWANRGGHCLRSGQERWKEHLGFRSWWRYIWRIDFDDR